MGGDQSLPEDQDQQIAHPKFKKIKFLNDNQILRTCIQI